MYVKIVKAIFKSPKCGDDALRMLYIRTQNEIGKICEKVREQESIETIKRIQTNEINNSIQ